jgi:DNA polymerase, archaea type
MNELLFGHNAEERIVAIQMLDESMMRLYVRKEGKLVSQDERFYPFLYLSDNTLLQGFPQKHWMKSLDGTLYFRWLCAFSDWNALWDAVRFVLTSYNRTAAKKAESHADIESLHLISDPVTQYLMQSGRTLFKGMRFEDLHRLQVDIETYTEIPGRFSNAARPADRILLISLSDNHGWTQVIDGRKQSEREMLLTLIETIRERDPDVVEGHNILGFDLPYLASRCALHHVEFTIGRGGALMRSTDHRGGTFDAPSGFSIIEIPGRHIIDTLLLVQAYDAVKRNMEQYGLKYAAQYFGLSASHRVYLDGDRIPWYWHNEPETLITYAQHDTYEAGQLSAVLAPTSFYLTQMVPATFSAVARMGAAAKIELLLLREYLRRKHSLPQQREGEQTTGGYTDMFFTGVLGPVLHVDVESLYPSIMITKGIYPAVDQLHIFSSILRELKDRRIAAKHAARAALDNDERVRLDAMQSSLKVLINSFYGYLGYSRALFNDFGQADAVTQAGQQILRQLIRAVIDEGGQVIEVDTDGIFFVPPPGVGDEDEEQALVKRLSQVLPEGITLGLDGRYRKMLSFKKKNYALLDDEGRTRMKGSSLISRAMERFARTFVRKAMGCVLASDIEGLHALFVETATAFLEHKMPVSEFARIETLRDPLSVYQEEVASARRNRSAAYEVALEAERKGNRVKVGDRISYYITGTDPNCKTSDYRKAAEEWDPHFPDENTRFYLRRLDDLAEKFSAFFRPQDFRKIFTVDDLFPFSPEGIAVLTLPVQGEDLELPDEPVSRQPGIWLDE